MYSTSNIVLVDVVIKLLWEGGGGGGDAND